MTLIDMLKNIAMKEKESMRSESGSVDDCTCTADECESDYIE